MLDSDGWGDGEQKRGDVVENGRRHVTAIKKTHLVARRWTVEECCVRRAGALHYLVGYT